MDGNSLAILGALALFVRFGHTLHTMGAVRARSVAAAAARALMGTASMVLLTYLAGHVLLWMYNDSTTGRAVGPGVYFATPTSFICVLATALLPSALIGGATAERARVRGIAIIAGILTAILLPLITALGWVGFSALDHRSAQGQYASSASLTALQPIWPVVVAHLLAGVGGLTIAKVIGARVGKYNRDGSANFIPAHSLPTMIAGDLLLFIGIPMMAAALAGDPAARVMNAMLAASAAVLCAVTVCSIRDRHVEVMAPWSAAIAGLVAGSVCGTNYPILSIPAGAIVGIVMPIASLKLDLKYRIDEVSGLALPHLLGAMVGLAFAGVAAVMESDSGVLHVALLTSVVVGAGVLVVLAGIVATALPAMVLRAKGYLRIDESVEQEGLDLAQHDINAYPDFQQTMIKSYHLRQ